MRLTLQRLRTRISHRAMDSLVFQQRRPLTHQRHRLHRRRRHVRRHRRGDFVFSRLLFHALLHQFRRSSRVRRQPVYLIRIHLGEAEAAEEAAEEEEEEEEQQQHQPRLLDPSFQACSTNPNR